MMWGYYGGWSWVWMAAMMVGFWGGLAVLAFWGARSLGLGGQSTDPALATLRQRLAAGEIGAEEFERTRRLLEARR